MAKPKTPEPSKGKSLHRHGDEIREVERNFDQAHLDANYHLQVWGEHSSPDHELIGLHEASGIVVDHVIDLPGAAGGPEFRLTLPSGVVLTVLCADVVRQYLEGRIDA